MSFEQTAIFYNLVNTFTKYGEEIRNDSGREEKAKTFFRRFERMHGEKNIKKFAQRRTKD